MQASEDAMATLLKIPVPDLMEATRRLHDGLLANGGGGAPVSALRVVNLFQPRLGGVQVCLNLSRSQIITLSKPQG